MVTEAVEGRVGDKDDSGNDSRVTEGAEVQMQMAHLKRWSWRGVTARLDIRSTVTFSYSQPSDKLTRGGKRATKDETWSSLEGPCVDTTGTATSSRISVA